MSDGGGRTARSARAYLLEITVIVFSILLAFALDRGYDWATDRREERVALEGLRQDFLKDREEVESQLLQIRQGEDAFAWVLEAMADPGMAQDTLPWDVMRYLFLGGTLDPFTATLDQLESAGRLDLLSDPELRSLLAEWRGEMQDARDQQVRTVELKAAHLWPLLAKGGYAIPPGMVDGFDPPPAAPQPPVARALPPEADAVLRQVAFRNFVVGMDMGSARDANEAVLARLDQLLGTSSPAPSNPSTP